MAWTNMATKANGVVIDQGDWNQLVNNFSWIGGADGDTHASVWRVGTAPYAATGTLRLPNGNAIAWRNGGNSGDLQMYANGSDQLVLGGASATWALLGTATTAAGYLAANINGTLYRIPLWT